MKPVGLLIAPLFALTTPLPAQEGSGDPDPELTASIEEWLAPLVDSGELSGTLLVARGDEILFEQAYGFASAEHRVPNRPSTRHNIASITKPMTIAITARLIEDGKLGLQDTLDDWIPGFENGEATVDHLLNHRAGIPHRVTAPEQETVPRSAEWMAAQAMTREPLCEPGAVSIYSSGGFAVLARILELAGGAAYEELLQTYVCSPAGMTRTLHTDSRAVVEGRSESYMPGMNGVRRAPLQDFSFLVGAGSVYSTARDLFRLQRAILAGKLGTVVAQALNRGTGYRWNGQTGGYRAFADHYRDTGLTVILVANRLSGANDLVRSQIPLLVADAEIDPPEVPQVSPVEVDAARLKSFEGTYEMRPGSELRCTAREGALYMNDWILIPTGEMTFYSPQDFGQIEMVTDADGQVEKLIWNGNEMAKIG